MGNPFRAHGPELGDLAILGKSRFWTLAETDTIAIYRPAKVAYLTRCEGPAANFSAKSLVLTGVPIGSTLAGQIHIQQVAICFERDLQGRHCGRQQ